MTDNGPEAPWWDTFFRSAWSDDVRSSMKPEDVTRQEADFIRKVLRLKAGDRVLDVPCGDGRLGLPLAESGCDVVGVDLQPRLIEAARREAARLRVRFEGREADMRDLPWLEEFDASFCFWGSFGYLDDDGNREFLEAVWRALKPDAPFLLDTQSIETTLTGFLEKDWIEAGNWTVLEERRFDCETSRLHGNWSFIGEGEIQKKQISIRMYTCRELTGLLAACGFGDFESYDTMTGNPFSLEASHLGLLARKKT